MAANTLLSCLDDVPPATGCADARAGKPGAKLGNNQWDMRYVDVDSEVECRQIAAPLTRRRTSSCDAQPASHQLLGLSDVVQQV